MMKENEIREVVPLLQSLVQIPSVTGNERAIAHHLKDYLEQIGFASEINDYNTVIGVLDLGEGPTVLLDGHIDTVNADPEQWTTSPYAGAEREGRIYGRGASDMKGALAAMLIAGKSLAQQQGLSGKVIITGTSWEEYFEGHTLGKAITALTDRGLKPDYVIIGEASELALKRGQRGRARVIVDIQGQAAHSAHPEKGINAVLQAQRFITALQARPCREDPFLGKHIVELIGIESLPNPVDSVVPYLCRVTYDLRLLTGETRESVLQEFNDVIQALHAADPTFEASLSLASGEIQLQSGGSERVEALPPAWELDEAHPLVRQAHQALQTLGMTPAITKYDFCTNGSYSAGIAGIPTIGFGPGKETTAHIVDEYVEIAELKQACAGYEAIVRALLAQ